VPLSPLYLRRVLVVVRKPSAL